MYKNLQENMSKILKAILMCAYGAVITKFITVLRMERHETLIEINYVFRKPMELKRLERMLKKNNVTVMAHSFKKPFRLHTDLKFILKFAKMFDFGFKYSPFNKGQQPFIDGQCEYHNCYFTTDKLLFGDMRNFDAIIFDIEYFWQSVPIFRAPHQKYIFTAMEPSIYYPVCAPHFEKFFNWTWTYKLDSDIVWTYISIYDNKNTIVGPKTNMTWIDPMGPVSQTVISKLAKKKKMAAWFVSFCKAKSERMNLTRDIGHHLQKFGFEIDIFGECGTLVCPKSRMEDCLELLQEEYYFYFAFENAKCEDYVSEKVLHALKSYTVPVVFGGADYTRFLPPRSYIDAGAQEPYVTASMMVDMVKNNDKQNYYDCFRWHNHYVYKESQDVSDVCSLCKLLNEQTHPTVVSNLRQWWHPGYRQACGDSYVEQRVDQLMKKANESDNHKIKSQWL